MGNKVQQFRTPMSGDLELFRLRPAASVAKIELPKTIGPHDPDYWDKQGQYDWRVPLRHLNSSGQKTSLELRVHTLKKEMENDIYTTYHIQGDGGAQSPGNDLEWQLRVRIYSDSHVVRLQMTWTMRWDPDRYALAGAGWQLTGKIGDEAWLFDQKDGLSLTEDGVRILADAPGTGVGQHGKQELFHTETPDDTCQVVTVSSGKKWLALGIPNFFRLGPNHVQVDKEMLEIASWSAELGHGLDLRHTGKIDEFGTVEPDVQANARGVARTLYASLCWGATKADAQHLAQQEAARAGLWFSSPEAIVTTGGMGPWRLYNVQEPDNYMEGLLLNLHFLLASSKYWRWYGFINYGDMRTNFSAGLIPERGLFPNRWSLYGRYGWRNGSFDAYLGLLTSGLFFGDRDVLFSGTDYAQHVADVDVCHPSLFSTARDKHDGGMHRRNKQHWSGSVQMQYTSSSGMYLAYWLTGNERLRDVLAEIRDFAWRDGGRSGSIFAASALINHYAETHDQDVLHKAWQLLESAANRWEDVALNHAIPETGEKLNPSIGWLEERDGKFTMKLKGIAALYAGNFRRPLDGYRVLIDFHQATDDNRILEAMLESICAHSNDKADAGFAIAYLLASGVSAERIGTNNIAKSQQWMEGITPTALPSRTCRDYDELVRVITEDLPPARSPMYRETGNIAYRASIAPLEWSVLKKRLDD